MLSRKYSSCLQILKKRLLNKTARKNRKRKKPNKNLKDHHFITKKPSAEKRKKKPERKTDRKPTFKKDKRYI